jgi:hypothetical protein
MPDRMTGKVAELQGLDSSELRNRWVEAFGGPPPKRMSRDLLLRALAYHAQEQAEGGLGKAARKHLMRLAQGSGVGPGPLSPLAAHLKPGTRLVREWRGEIHQVTVLEDGFDYRGGQYNSLSRIALRITGTRWSGPLFFGLRKSRARFKEDGDGR